MAKDVYYFSHDSNARHDPNITAMRSVYCVKGLGRFWILVEMMREADGFKLSSIGKYVWNAYAKEMECESSEDALQFIKDCIEEFELFESDGEYFWSRSLLKRMDKKEQVKQKRIDAANARWNKVASDKDSSSSDHADEMQMECKCIEKPCKCDALKEIKLKEIKLKEIKDSTTTTNAFRYYQENFGTLAPAITEKISQWIDDISEPVVIMAMDIAIGKNKMQWSTVNNVLTGWFNQNVRTAEEAKAAEVRYSNQRGEKPNAKSGKDPEDTYAKYDFGF